MTVYSEIKRTLLGKTERNPQVTFKNVVILHRQTIKPRLAVLFDILFNQLVLLFGKEIIIFFSSVFRLSSVADEEKGTTRIADTIYTM